MSPKAGKETQRPQRNAGAASLPGGREEKPALRLVLARRTEACDPLPWFASLRDADRFYWECAEDALAIAARGALTAIEAKGEQRFARVAEKVRELMTRSRFEGAAGAPALPTLVGGFAFGGERAASGPWKGFPPARWVLPEQLVMRRGQGAWAQLALALPPDASRRQVEQCIADSEAKFRALEDALRRAAAAWKPGGFGPRALERAAREPRREPGADSEPQRGLWLEEAPGRAYEGRIRRAVESIRRGELEKVVVACAARRAAGSFDVGAILATLRSRHRGCRLFAVGRGRHVFLGASPERLIRVDADRVAVDAIAGSAPRGRSAAEDERIARELAESKKEQEEHAIVVRAIRSALEGRCRELLVPEAPHVKRLAGIQHLETPIRARLAEPHPFALFELLPELHPTPAVAGAPREAALAWLRRHEGLARGWYAGLVGWLDAKGDGELAVALRSALLRPGELRLFAGAGVVAGSDPGAEVRETELKLGAAGEALLAGLP